MLVADLGVASRIRDRLGHERVRCVSLGTAPEHTSRPLLFATAIPIPWALIARMAIVNRGEFRAIECGAAGYISMAMSRVAMDRAIAGIRRSEPAFTRRTLGRWLRSQQTARPRARGSTLPKRQREIVALIAEGKSDKEIAAMLGIAVNTVRKHVSKMLRRLGAPNRAAAVASEHATC
jgi:DNA-binding CsgD family transcriptional regulator